MASLLLSPAMQYEDSNGDPLSAGTIAFYDTNTTTLKAVYSDADLTTLLANPFTLDSAGRMSVNAYVADGERYTIVVRDSAGATIITRNDVWGIREEVSESTYTAGFSGAVSVTLQSRLDDRLSASGFGATGDGTTDDTAAINSLIAAGKYIHFPAGTYVYDGIPAFDGHIITGDDAVLEITAGVHTSASPCHIQSIQGLKIKGQDHETLTVNSIGTVTGSAGGYTVPLNVSSEGSAGAGDFVVVDGVTASSGQPRQLEGGWKIASVSSGVVNITHTHRHATFPALTVTGGSAQLLTSVWQFTGGSQGIVVSTGALTMEDLAVELTGTSDADGTKCLHVGIHRSGQDYEHGNASVLLEQFVCFSGAGNHGVVIGGSSRLMSRPGNASCNNFQDGWHFTEGGSGFIKFTTANGNGESGYMAEQNGHVECDGGSACGNGQDGFECIAGGRMGCNQSTTIASYNQRHGAFADTNGHIRCGQGTFEYSQSNGIFATDNSFIEASDTTVNNSVGRGVYATKKAHIVFDDGTSNSNTGADIEADTRSFIVGSGTITTDDTALSQNRSTVLLGGSYTAETWGGGDIDRISMTPQTVAGAPSGNAGDLAYFSNGDAGSPCFAVHNGTNWLRIALGTAVASS